MAVYTESISLYLTLSRVVSDTDMSAPSAPAVDPIAWEEESAESRMHRRARHLHIANDPDPKHKSIAQQALALAGPLADIEDAIIHMDGFSLGDEADSDLFEGHIKVLRKMRATRGIFTLKKEERKPTLVSCLYPFRKNGRTNGGT